MEFVWFVIIVVFWKVWVYPILHFFSLFLPESKESRKEPKVHVNKRSKYEDNTPDPFIDLTHSTGWTANQFMSAEAKAAYLLSDEWTWLRTEVLARDHFKCQVCGSIHNLAVHHITYINLGAEQLEDLITLCNFHHQAIHDLLGYDRTTIFNLNTKDKYV